MKNILLLFIIMAFTASASAQKTMMVEKIGTSHRYFFKTGDYIKLKISKPDTLLKGKLWSIDDSAVFVSDFRPFEVSVRQINAVYKRFDAPRKMAYTTLIGSLGIFCIITINHVINNETVISPDALLISGGVAAAGLITLSFSEKKMKTGSRWKIKILDLVVYE
ncbi:MAG: hypothetical protein PHP04_06760 [Bacteroidales bacterium]|nr:hypothetical protein [Bacteroidales bacterium]HNW73042.1 hypothetical protein [Bacteroidales bacterium]HPS49927.1 hypothetical protein [Bacteroidales bacterium]